MENVHVFELPAWQHPKLGIVRRFSLKSAELEVVVISLGATISQFYVNHDDGNKTNIVLGYDNLNDYLNQQAYLGAVVGRYANRIAGGQLNFKNQTFQLNQNQFPHTLHGGKTGFSHKNWQASKRKNGVRFQLMSDDGDMGFPGHCETWVDYYLENNQLVMEIFATVSRPCPLNFTGHSYFNLDGLADIGQHQLQINAKKYAQINQTGIPVDYCDVAGSPFDLSKPSALNTCLTSPELMPTRGFDHCYLLANKDLAPAAIATSKSSGITLKLFTNQPSLQLYTGNYLSTTTNNFRDHQGFCLEPGLPPNAPNDNRWQQVVPHQTNTWTHPFERYHHITRYEITT